MIAGKKPERRHSHFGIRFLAPAKPSILQELLEVLIEHDND